MPSVEAPATHRVFTMGSGKVTHAAQLADTRTAGNERITNPRLSANRVVTCAHCVRALDQGETMADSAEHKRSDVNTDEGRAVIEQIDADIERARSLTDADALPSLAELKEETETLISSLSGRGVAAIKASKRAAWGEAEAFALKAIEAANAEPASAEVAEPDVMSIEGMPELIEAGAERIAEGVRLHIKAAATAKDLARIGLDMWRRIPNSDDLPDIMGDSDRAKKASGMLKDAAAEALRKAHSKEEGFDLEEALRKFWRSVVDQRSDVRAEYLRALDGDSDEAEAERQRYAKILEGKPDDVPVSEAVAVVYGVKTKGQTEIKRERYRAKMAALAKGETWEEPKGDQPALPAIERGKTVVKTLKRDLTKFTPEDVKALSKEEREELKPEIEAMFTAAKALMAEFI